LKISSIYTLDEDQSYRDLKMYIIGNFLKH